MWLQRILILGLLVAFARTGDAYQFIEFLNPDNEVVRLEWGRDSMPVTYYFNVNPPRDFSL